MREKAADRNPDEFHFGMMSSRTSGGIKIAERGGDQNKPLGAEVVKLLKTQDAAYLRTMAQRTRRERERMEEEGGLGLVGGGSVVLREGFQRRKNKKRDGDGYVAFVGSREEQLAFGKERDNKVAEVDDNVVVDTNDRGRRVTNLPAGKGDGTRQKSYLLDEEIVKNRRRWRDNRIRHYEALKSREDNLKKAEAELERQRAKMTNNIGGVNKNGIKYKIRERKR